MSADSPPKPVLHLLAGPTASGKTELSLKWAQIHGALIVSCDSLLVYRGMDIGSAKPTREELARAPHACVDVADPAEGPYSVALYVAEAKRAIDAACAEGRPVLVTGGSGFYLKSFFAPVTDSVEVHDDLRREIGSLTPETALRRLLELEPQPPSWLDLKNPRRVNKALERRIAAGVPLVEIKAAFDAIPGPFDAFEKRLVILARSTESLHARIRLRAEGMVRDGLISEVEALAVSGLKQDSPAAVAVGYRQTIAWLASGRRGGEKALAEAVCLATLRLAAKQRKWLRTQLPANALTLNLDEAKPDIPNLFRNPGQAGSH